MKNSKVNGKKLSLDFGLDFPFPMGNPVREGERGSNLRGFSDGSSKADRVIFHSPLSLNNQGI